MNGNTHPAVPAAQPRAEETIEVPQGVRVRCPLAEYRLRAVAAHCPACEHFRGMADRFPGSRHGFTVRFSVLCAGEPVKRELFELELGAGAAGDKA
jgi:hypothetical protein